MLFVDLSLVAFATLFALVLRDNLELSPSRLRELLPYLGVTLIVAVPIMLAFGLNRGSWRFASLDDHLRIVGAAVVTVVASVAIGFTAFRLEGVARSLPLMQGILMIAALVSVRVLVRVRTRSSALDKSPRLPVVSGSRENVIIVGLNRITELFLHSAAELAPSKMRIAGLVSHGEPYNAQDFASHRVLGVPENIESIVRMLDVHGVRVDRIVVTVAFDRLPARARRALLAVEQSSDIRLDLFAERIGLAKSPNDLTPPPAIGQSAADEGPSAADVRALERHMFWRTKRVLDAIAAACLIVLLAPVTFVVALVVLLDVGLPLLFWQERPGRWGRPFRLYKFRTMSAPLNARGERVPDDQRLSAIGKFMRRFRLDELPQLFNILAGSMSFVGPRPLLAIDHSDRAAARLLVPPGLTGWAQVKGGRVLSGADKAALDIWYVRNASFSLDLQILFATLPVLLRGESVSSNAVQRAWRELSADTPEVGEIATAMRGAGGGLASSRGSDTHRESGHRGLP